MALTPFDLACTGWTLLAASAAPAFALLARAWHRVSHRYPQTLADWPSVSVVRPVRGTSPELESNLESTLTCGYHGPLELLCCIETPDDPAALVIESLRSRYPDRVRLVISHGEGSIFGKHANLIAGAHAARHEVLICSDADVWWPPGILAELIPPLSDPRIGGATAVFWQEPKAGAASRLMAEFVAAYGYAPNLAARYLRMLPNAIGGLMAFRLDYLESLGGFAAIIHDKISDDGALGNAVRAAGRELYLCRQPFLVRRSEGAISAVAANVHRWMLMFKGQGTWAYFQMLGVCPWFPLGVWLLGSLLGWGAMPLGTLLVLALLIAVSELLWGRITTSRYCPFESARHLGAGRPLAGLLFAITWLGALLWPLTVWGSRRYRVPLGGRARLLGWVTSVKGN